jgi:hypothetical protein
MIRHPDNPRPDFRRIIGFPSDAYIRRFSPLYFLSTHKTKDKYNGSFNPRQLPQGHLHWPKLRVSLRLSQFPPPLHRN